LRTEENMKSVISNVELRDGESQPTEAVTAAVP
jgi:hypothetical protein